MNRLLFRAALLFTVCILHACREGDRGSWIKIGGNAQGTTYGVTYLSPDSTDYQEDIERKLKEFDSSLSTYLPSSLISRFNRDEEGVFPDPYFLTCFSCSEEVFRSTGGAFDITVAPLVNAWGFGFTERSEIDSSLIDSLLEFVGMENVWFEDGMIRKKMPGVMLDMNAIAQGYAVDVLAGFLDMQGILNYLVEIGGEMRTKGHNPRGLQWRVGIDRPVDGLQIPGDELQAIVEFTGRSLATSGNYRRFYEKDGMKYSHTIDPGTGYPVQHGLLSATVMAEDCMRADAYATAFMVMGFEKSRDFLLNRSGMDAYLIYNDDEGVYTVWYTEGMKNLLAKGSDRQ